MQRIWRYLQEVRAELYKATWPWDPKEKGFARYKELTDGTVVVFISMIMLAGFVGAFDFLLRKVFEGVISL
jgi:preprotein translocase subunit SecE